LGRSGAFFIAGVALAGLLAPHAGSFDTAMLIGSGAQVTMVIVLSLLAASVFRLVSDAEGQQRRAAAELETANRNLVKLLQDKQVESKKKAVLNEMSELIQSCASIEEAFSILASYGRRLFSAHAGAFFIYRNSRDYLELTAHWGDLPPEHLRSFTAGECWALRRGRLYRAGSASGDILCPHLEATSGARADAICVPMMAHGEILGVFHLAAASSASTDETLASSVARDGALGLANLQLRDALRNQALRDPLTQLYNRRYLEESLPREIHRAERRNQALALAMLDIDHFKTFNDTYGHEAGDMVLHEVGAILRSFTRAEDLACRYGGEEFVLIFAETPLEDAFRRIETLRARISAAGIMHAGQPLGRITVSAGLAATPGTHGTALLKTADQLLYRAKAAGRDRVVCTSQDPDVDTQALSSNTQEHTA
jgi:diguanylate cyclase (GGDEF)-like protein